MNDISEPKRKTKKTPVKKGTAIKVKNTKKHGRFLFVLCMCLISIILGSILVYFLTSDTKFSEADNNIISKNIVKSDTQTSDSVSTIPTTIIPVLPPLDTAAYDKKLNEIANNPVIIAPPVTNDTTSSTVTNKTSTKNVAKKIVPKPKPVLPNIWPVKTAYPNAGALLPFNRIIAFYGNFYSTKMGILGQYPSDEVIKKLNAVVAQWNAADPSTPVIPAIDYIAVSAQGSAGSDGKYRLRMPFDQIDKALAMANQVHGVLFLDIQVGQSNLETEIPPLEKYLAMPNVELAIDPEFAMHNGIKPGRYIGTIDAKDVNWTANYLASLVKANNIPPKILVIHRFTENSVTNYKQITPLPEVQIVMDMDGWGAEPNKIAIYNEIIYPEPIQFTGFKLFYKNDLLPPSTGLLSPSQLLKLRPQPSYIQYQ